MLALHLQSAEGRPKILMVAELQEVGSRKSNLSCVGESHLVSACTYPAQSGVELTGRFVSGWTPLDKP